MQAVLFAAVLLLCATDAGAFVLPFSAGMPRASRAPSVVTQARSLRAAGSAIRMSGKQEAVRKRERKGRRMTQCASGGGAESKFAQLIADCKDWGLCRFITINAGGAVLETASPMDVGLNFFEVPGKGQYATLASADKLFECHIRLDAAAKATFAKEAAKIGGHDLYVMRLKTSDDTILLSCMLQYDPAKGPGHYFDGAVEKFERVQSKWGNEASLS